MLKTVYATRGVVVAPHALAAQAGLSVLREGGNALDAAIAVAAGLAVVYPHMSGIGGDSFWLLYAPGQAPRVIDACGRSAVRSSAEAFISQGLRQIPERGVAALNTVAGTLSGWQAAHHYSQKHWDGRLPMSRLLEDAIHYAEQGCPVSASLAASIRARQADLAALPGLFRTVYLPEGQPPALGTLLRQPQLGATLRYLSQAGLWDFYKGNLAHSIADDLRHLGSPLRFEDLQAHQVDSPGALSLVHSQGRLYSTPAPTQGVSSLIILGLFDRLSAHHKPPCDSASHIHLLVEASKLAFGVRDRFVGDPAHMGRQRLDAWLQPKELDRLARQVTVAQAAPWRAQGGGGDTTWFGVIDRQGRAASVIQSLYHDFGSGVVLPGSGICWQNRGCSFSLRSGSVNYLRPASKPRHTLNPALALLNDGRVLSYGTMGGDGQPQTLGALFSRYVDYGCDLQTALDAPRWLLGRAWGKTSDPHSLKLESRFAPAVAEGLRRLGHTVEELGAYEEVMGHAGALVWRPDGVLEAAFDPRSDGAALGY